MQFNFFDQIAIITGGTRGIGRSISEAFLKAGAKVIATYKENHKAAEAFCKDNQEYVSQLQISSFDVANSEGVEKFYKLVEKQYGQFQILINNSGIRRDSIVGMMKEEDWLEVINANLNGTYLMSKLAVHHFMQQKYGRIITITSPVGRIGFAGQSNYAASKSAQVAFTKSLSKEIASRGITANCISPGFIETDFISDLTDKQRETYKALVPLKRFGKPEEVANTVLFLASKETSYITGTTIEVSGGL